MGTQLV